MSLQGDRTAEMFRRGRSALVNGVSSMFRYWGPDDTLVIDRGEGAYLFDMDGKRYLDFLGTPLDRVRHVPIHLLSRCLVVEGPHVGGFVEGVAEPHLPGSLHRRLDELVVDFVEHD